MRGRGAGGVVGALVVGVVTGTVVDVVEVVAVVDVVARLVDVAALVVVGLVWCLLPLHAPKSTIAAKIASGTAAMERTRDVRMA